VLSHTKDPDEIPTKSQNTGGLVEIQPVSHYVMETMPDVTTEC